MADPNEFFKEGSTSLATFYPTHYVVAGYHNLADAEAAARTCVKVGFPDHDVRTFEGNFVMSQMESREGSNWLERVQQQFVEAFGTEAGYIGEDDDLARAGGAFLFVYAPDDGKVDMARRVFAQHGPAYARRYLKIAIEIIVENPNAA